ncbi:MAG: hypothetical protein V1749_08280 [Candidatus Desantisbacteria bacterium]
MRYKFNQCSIILLMAILFTGCATMQTMQSTWESTKSVNTIGAYEDFLKQYSEGEFSDEAKASLQNLKEQLEIRLLAAYITPVEITTKGSDVVISCQISGKEVHLINKEDLVVVVAIDAKNKPITLLYYKFDMSLEQIQFRIKNPDGILSGKGNAYIYLALAKGLLKPIFEDSEVRRFEGVALISNTRVSNVLTIIATFE